MMLIIAILISFIVGYYLGHVHFNSCILPSKLAAYVLHIIMRVDEENRQKILETISEIKNNEKLEI